MSRRIAHKLRLTMGVAACLVALVLSFQNCGKPGQFSQMQALPGSEIYKVAAGGFRELVMPDLSNHRSLELNVDSGTISASDGNRYCLSSADLQKLQDLLNSASVCGPPTQAADMVCAMIYQSPYAELRSASQSLALGEARSACDRGMDLCGGAAAQLRDFVSNVISGINGMQCN